MSHRCTSWAFEQAERIKDPTALLVLIALADYADRDTWQAWPSHKSLAGMVYVSIPTVKRKLNLLAEIGLITWENRGRKDGGKSSNIYKLLLGEQPEEVEPPIDQNDPSIDHPDDLGDRSPVDLGDGSTGDLGTVNEPSIQPSLKEAARPIHDWQKTQREFESPALRRFQTLYPKNARYKAELRRQWWDQGCEDIADEIFQKLTLQLAECAEFEKAQFMPVAETYLSERKWENKIVPRADAEKAAEQKPAHRRPVCTACHKEKSSYVSDGRCMDCFESGATQQPMRASL